MADIETSAREVGSADIAFAAPPRPRGWLARVGLRREPAEISPEPVSLGGPEPQPRRWSGYLISFIAMVILPALASTFYFLFIASDQYLAETRFAVHSMMMDTVTRESKSTKSNTTSSFMGGLTAANDDSYMVAAYIRSRACVEEVSRTIDLRAVFRRPEADMWARLKANASPEELKKYWDRMIVAYVDPPSGIVTVTVSAFRREDALAVAQAILAAAEKVANEVSARARDDVMRAANKEVAGAEDRVLSTLVDLRAFREKAGFIDPKLQAESMGRVLEDLIGERLKAETEYTVSSRAMSPEAPTLQSLKTRIEQLDLQIASEKAKLTTRSKNPTSLANLLPKYEELLTRNTFAEKLYGLAADGLERARLRAAAQTIYVNVFVPPALPQDALYPERFASSGLLAIAFLIVWGICALTAALVEDHKL